MSETLIAFIEGAMFILAPVLLLFAVGFPVLMVTWARSVPLSDRLPWAAAAALPLSLLFAYVTWALPAFRVLRDAGWLTLSLAGIAYVLATGVALAFRRRHVRRSGDQGDSLT